VFDEVNALTDLKTQRKRNLLARCTRRDYKEDQPLIEAFPLEQFQQIPERNGGLRIYARAQQGRRLAAE